MSDVAIRVEGLGKRYRLMHQRPHDTLRDLISDRARRMFRARSNRTRETASPSEPFWALKDVSFEVRKGEVLGIIGRNGAGKSTLLKILSRITEMTEGAVDIFGRVGSLLEIGTGFHPELTGRENIYLNGAILGMKQSEVRGRFDEIVDFSEVEKFLDTPVKHYSSGMYTRLAFAVAAHLDPEILIVDEVLAVGDLSFQKKCLGKMRQAACDGRTVLFVSHNLTAITELCTRAILLNNGEVCAEGSPADVLHAYAPTVQPAENVKSFANLPRATDCRDNARLLSVELLGSHKIGAWGIAFGGELHFAVRVAINKTLPGVELGMALFSPLGFEIASSVSSQTADAPSLAAGVYEFKLCYRNFLLTPGSYYCAIGVRSESGFEDRIARAFDFEVLGASGGGKYRLTKLGGVVLPDVNYEISQLS